ncbi:MAG: hypothetical protein RLZZ444_517 [Pseudomonadota bacterium]|jgi:sugar lactone lactonase YvrE
MFEIHAENLGFPEGPVALPDGSVAFVDLLHRKVRRWHDGKVEVIADIPGSPNGMRLGPDGALYIANNGGLAPKGLHELDRAEPLISGRIQRLTLDGKLSDHITGLDGNGPWRPNDLVFTPEGSILFTDPQNWEDIRTWENADDIPGYHGGRLYLGRSDGTARVLAPYYGFPNGLVFHPDGSLIVAVTLHKRLVKFSWDGENLGSPTTWLNFDNGTAPDGILYHEGLFYIAGSVSDKLTIVDDKGRFVRSIDLDEGSDPTNLCIQNGRLFVTLGLMGKLVSFDLSALA